MQRVPVDPLAGPAAKAAAESPKPDPVKPHVPVKAIAKADKPVPVIQPAIAVAAKPVVAVAKADKPMPDVKSAPAVAVAKSDKPVVTVAKATPVVSAASAEPAQDRQGARQYCSASRHGRESRQAGCGSARHHLGQGRSAGG